MSACVTAGEGPPANLFVTELKDGRALNFRFPAPGIDKAFARLKS